MIWVSKGWMIPQFFEHPTMRGAAPVTRNASMCINHELSIPQPLLVPNSFDDIWNITLNVKRLYFEYTNGLHGTFRHLDLKNDFSMTNWEYSMI